MNIQTVSPFISFTSKRKRGNKLPPLQNVEGVLKTFDGESISREIMVALRKLPIGGCATVSSDLSNEIESFSIKKHSEDRVEMSILFAKNKGEYRIEINPHKTKAAKQIRKIRYLRSDSTDILPKDAAIAVINKYFGSEWPDKYDMTNQSRPRNDHPTLGGSRLAGQGPW